MTQEKKAKLYDEALERAKEFIVASAVYDKFTIEKIFPELKESEDERIRKELIDFVKSRLAGFPECDRFIAWLEKQGEKPRGKSALEAIKEEKVDNQNCVKPTDKVEPRFHEGDWVIHGHNILKIRCVGNEYYCIETVGGYVDNMLVSEIDSLYHLWTIQDARDGDLLICDINKAEIGGDVEKLPNIVSTIFIFKNVVSSRDYIHSYCHLYDRRVLGVQNTMYYNSFVYNIHPATKGQRELLFEKIKEAGCERDADNKELRKVEIK